MNVDVAFHLISNLSHTVDDQHSVEVGPVVMLLEPTALVDHRGSPGLDALHGLLTTDLAVLELAGLGHEHDHLPEMPLAKGRKRRSRSGFLRPSRAMSAIASALASTASRQRSGISSGG